MPIIDRPIRLIELFAGIGAQAKALENLHVEFERWVVCDFDEAAIRSYNAVHGTDFRKSDITKLSAEDLNIIDTDTYTYMLTYSFPCQDLSSAGKARGMEKGSGTRSGLLWEVERLLDSCRDLPQVLVMENVPLVHSKNNLPSFNAWVKFLESKGYSNYWKDLNSKDYGVPQSRNRCIMVSILGEAHYEFPTPIPLKKNLGDLLDEKVDRHYYLTEPRLTPFSTDSGPLRGTVLQREVCDKALSQTKPYEVIDYTYSNSRLQEITAGQIKVKNKNYPGVMNTLTTCADHFGVRLPEGAFRILTPRECWRLMGFSDEDFAKACTVSDVAQLYKQAGNSIVVDVLTAVFKQLVTPLNSDLL